MQYGFPTRNSEKRTEHFTDGGFPVQRDGHIDRILHAWKAWHAAMHSFSVEKCEPEIELQSRRKRKDDMLIVVKYWLWLAGITLIRICRTSAEVAPNPWLQNLP